jgi:hypothetical protein
MWSRFENFSAWRPLLCEAIGFYPFEMMAAFGLGPPFTATTSRTAPGWWRRIAQFAIRHAESLVAPVRNMLKTRGPFFALPLVAEVSHQGRSGELWVANSYNPILKRLKYWHHPS